MEPLYDAPDAGTGGGGEGDGDDAGFTGEHPDFEIPNGDEGAGGEAAGGAKPAAKAGAAAGSGTGQEGDGTGAAGAKPGTTEQIPGYRLQEVIRDRDGLKTQLSTLLEENGRFKKLIAGALGIEDPNNPGAPKPLGEREQKIADRIVELLPWLKDLKVLADKVGPLSGLADSVPQFQRQNQAYWTRLAANTMSAVEDAIAPLFLGEGKKGSDLTPQLKTRYRADFIGWVKSDEKRVDRYESGDRTLVEDYRKELDETVIAPVRRQYGAAAIRSGQQRAKLPVAGTGSAPTVGAAPKKPEALNEDTAADAAWLKLKELTTVGA